MGSETITFDFKSSNLHQVYFPARLFKTSDALTTGPQQLAPHRILGCKIHKFETTYKRIKCHNYMCVDVFYELTHLPFEFFLKYMKLATLLTRKRANKFSKNKKVLLRERKKHTAHRIASTRCAVLYPGGGYLPWPGVPKLERGYLPWPVGTYPG